MGKLYQAFDIVVHRTLFGEWEITTLGNFFELNGKEYNEREVAKVSTKDLPTFEDCVRYLRADPLNIKTNICGI